MLAAPPAVATVAPLTAEMFELTGAGDERAVNAALDAGAEVALVPGGLYILQGPVLVPPGARLHVNGAVIDRSKIISDGGVITDD